MAEPAAGPSFSIVVETDNLELAEPEALQECLDSLEAQQPLIGQAKGIFLVDSEQVSDATVRTLGRAYPWLTVVRAGPETQYVGLKAHGAALSDSDLIVFCDADLRYEAGWLDALLSAFAEKPEAQIVAGETTTPIRGPYSLAIALTFVFPRFTDETALASSPTYWANNVAVRRAALDGAPIPDPAVLYRGQNILHSLELRRLGVTIWRQPRARAQHIVIAPGWILGRYLTLGRDSASIAGLTRAASGSPYLAAMAPDEGGGNRLRKLAGRIRQVARSEPLQLVWLPLALPVVGLFALCYLVGWLSRTLRQAGS